MVLMRINGSGITSVEMPFQKARRIPYSVEADNAELRHYLARLAHKSRCFSRCLYALECALRLFVFAFNNRQLHKQRFPNYAAHVMDFVSPSYLTLSQLAI
jgi:IS1 family transposase